MKIIFLLAVICLCKPVFGQQHLALLIGINKYEPPKGAKINESRDYFQDLGGPVNDVKAINAMIQAKYNFKPKDIVVLLNENAGRDGILKGLKDLYARSKKGDIVFIYYAGHGSFVNNSLSNEEDQLDESIVPADSWKPGVRDIRDKELAVFFNQFITKGVVLTCIFDCCHSGSMQRGGFPAMQLRARQMPSPDYDVRDASTPPVPELLPNSNFLFLSACQDREKAMEFVSGPDGGFGIFTTSLFQALNQQSPDASVNNIFAATSALVSTRISQSPVIAGDPTRMQGTLFGIRKGVLPDKNLVAVIVDSLNRIIVQGGTLMGLNKENELSSTNGKLQLKIISVLGPVSSQAKLVKGDLKELKKTGLFEVTNWVSPDQPQLKLYVPDSKLSYEEILQVKQTVSQLGNQVITDFRSKDPELSLFYFDNKWWYDDSTGKLQGVDELTATRLATIAGQKILSINIPASQNLASAIKKRFADMKNVQIVTNPMEADYILYGSIQNDLPAYSFVRVQVKVSDSLGMMPMQTLIFPLKGAGEKDMNYVTDSLYEYSIRLAKVRTWLTIQPPHISTFPVHLELRSKEGKRLDTLSSGLKVGQHFDLVLALNDDFEKKYDQKTKFIYAFAIDKDGKMSLLYPKSAATSTQNIFPKQDDDGKLIKATKIHTKLYVTTPVGTDNYFLLVSDQRIDNPNAMNQPGVRGVNDKGGLNAILNIGNEVRTRSAPAITPAVWTVKRMAVVTRH